MHRHVALSFFLLACSEPAAPPPPAPAPEATAPAITPAELLADADARTLTDRMRSAVRDPDPHLRARAVLALARLHDPGAAPLLDSALRDPDPAVRDHASLGLAALEANAPEDAAPALLGAVAAEPDPARRGHLLEDAGRLATDEVLAAFPGALSSDHADDRRGACRGMGAAGLRGRSVPADLLRRAAERMVDDASPGVRLACAYALTRIAPPEDTAELTPVADLLARALGDPDADVRAMAYRALARYPAATFERIAEGTRDPDWPVAVHAFRTLARRAASEHRETDLAAELTQALDRLLEGGDVRSGGPVHVLLAALEAAGPLASSPEIRAASEAGLGRLARVPEGASATRDRGIAHCAFARLADLGQGAPTRVHGCGLGQVSEVERKVLAAGVVAEAVGGEGERLAYVERRLLRDESPTVREAALGALGAIDAPGAVPLVVRAVRRETDTGARNAAMEALRAAHARRTQQLAAALLAGTDATDTWPHADVVPAMRAAGDAVLAEGDLEGLVTWLGVAGEVAPRELAERALPLASHPNLAVRAALRELLAAAGADPPAATPAPPPNPLAADAIAAAPSGRAVVETDRGRFVITLRPDLAPTTVVRFAGLVRDGFYDGLTFHRVVPAFVVQGGDPRGDGYGGPGWSQRCEDHRLPYARGTVGMALAGRDTGGSQFFVTVTPQPHLDARYTAFGEVTQGMEVVEALQAGDRIRTIRIEPAP